MSHSIEYTITGSNHQSSWWFEIDVLKLPPGINTARLTGVRGYDFSEISENLLFGKQGENMINKGCFMVGLGKTLLKVDSKNINKHWSPRNSIQFCLTTKSLKCYTEEFHCGNKKDTIVVNSSILTQKPNPKSKSKSNEKKRKNEFIDTNSAESILISLKDDKSKELDDCDKPIKKRKITGIFDVETLVHFTQSLIENKEMIQKEKALLIKALNDCDKELEIIEKIVDRIDF